MASQAGGCPNGMLKHLNKNYATVRLLSEKRAPLAVPDDFQSYPAETP